ncbi:SAM-dependent methyltransferase [Micromonospora sp. CPCC 206061]|uniref:SAM-dependent methyltransferase n=1 Tax=Micromonospora sp. CPCC 206061 TaxID=3122410 RepID=UPI002FEEB1E3
MNWQDAMENALYGPRGFFTTGAGPAAHFRTSVHASPLFVSAVLRLITHLDEALDHPHPLDVVDVGAGRGELLTALASAAPAALGDRLRLTAVERAARPPRLPDTIRWRPELPTGVTGLLIATEWLDNIPLDVVDGDRYVTVDPAGIEEPGAPVTPDDAAWLARWWPGGGRAEVGLPRDRAWARAVRAVSRGLALAVDYGHLRDARPFGGTLTGYRAGRQVPPVPDGSCDITAHVAIDAVAEAGGWPYTLVSQREALRALGVSGARPPITLASTDPAGYVRALAAASAAAELTEPAGLGAHWWLLHLIGLDSLPLLPNVGRWRDD